MAAVHLLRDGGKPFNLKLYPPSGGGILEEYHLYSDPELDEERTRIVTELHPAPDKLTEWAWKAHKRNLNIISDVKLDNPVDLVVYAHKSKRVAGGTKLGIDYALSLGIQTFNVVHDDISELFKIVA